MLNLVNLPQTPSPLWQETRDLFVSEEVANNVPEWLRSQQSHAREIHKLF